MSLTISSSPAYRSFVGNPIRFSLLTDSEQPLLCSLTIDGQVVYNFTHIPFQGVCLFDIADILAAYIDTPIPESSQTDIVTPIRQGYAVYYTLTVTTGIESETFTFDGIGFQGGISKRLMRELQSKGLDMFSYRLCNPQRQFFFTTRTNGRNIRIRENEVTPLIFLAPVENITLVTDSGRLITITGLATQTLYALNIPAVRKTVFDTYNELPAYFSLLIADHYVCDITLLPTISAIEHNVLLFRNSLGTYECISFDAVSTRTLESADKDQSSYTLFDPQTSGYVTGYFRLPVSPVQSTETGIRPPSELLFLSDLLSSDDVYLLTSDKSAIPVHVTADKFQLPGISIEPISVSVTISAVESDAFYSPEADFRQPSNRFGEWIFENKYLNSWGIIYNNRRLIENNNS